MREFQLRHGGDVVFPHRCRCGSQDRPLVDTMVEDQIGRVYICPRCVGQAAALLGHIDADTATGLRDQIDERDDRIRDLEGKLEEATSLEGRMISYDELVAGLSRETPEQPAEKAKARA